MNSCHKYLCHLLRRRFYFLLGCCHFKFQFTSIRNMLTIKCFFLTEENVAYPNPWEQPVARSRITTISSRSPNIAWWSFGLLVWRLRNMELGLGSLDAWYQIECTSWLRKLESLVSIWSKPFNALSIKLTKIEAQQSHQINRDEGFQAIRRWPSGNWNNHGSSGMKKLESFTTYALPKCKNFMWHIWWQHLALARDGYPPCKLRRTSRVCALYPFHWARVFIPNLCYLLKNLKTHY